MQVDIQWLDEDKRIVLWNFSGLWQTKIYIRTANNFVSQAQKTAHYMIWDLQNLIITKELSNPDVFLKTNHESHSNLQRYFSRDEFQKLLIVIDLQHPFTNFLRKSAIATDSIVFIEFAESLDEALTKIYN